MGRHGCQRWKCREALFSALLLLSDLTPVPGSRKTCPSRCLKSCHSKSVMISVSLKSVASSSSMTSSAAPVAHAGCTRRRPGRRDSAGALPVRWSVGYPDRPRMPAAGLRRPPSRSARTTWPLWGSSLRAPSVAGDLPPPHRLTGFPQPVATLLPPNRARQAYDPAAQSLGRSAAPRQQHQPSLRAAASSSAEHGQIRRPIFVPRPGHTVSAVRRRRHERAAVQRRQLHHPHHRRRRLARRSTDHGSMAPEGVHSR